MLSQSQPELHDKNAEIADWLIRLSHHLRKRGMGLRFLHPRKMKGFS
jgi:putative transposase